jgi:hypothetical protein
MDNSFIKKIIIKQGKLKSQFQAQQKSPLIFIVRIFGDPIFEYLNPHNRKICHKFECGI